MIPLSEFALHMLFLVICFGLGYLTGYFRRETIMKKQWRQVQDERAKLVIERQGFEAQKKIVALAGDAFLAIRRNHQIIDGD